MPGVIRPPRAPVPARLPVLLLPVRLETRFGGTPQRPELRVRVYPDQIGVDAHDPRFTAAEVGAAHRYWRALWRAGTSDADAARRAFGALAERFGAPRATYLAEAAELAPSNLGDRPAAPAPGGRPPSPAPAFAAVPPELERGAAWARAPRARGLPRRWTVALERGAARVHTAVGAAIPTGLAFGPDPASPPQPTPEGLQVDAGMRWMVDFEEAVRVGMALRIPISTQDVAAGFDRVLVWGLSGDDPKASSVAMAEILAAHRFTDGLALVPQGAATNNTADGRAAVTASDPGFERSGRLVTGGAPRPRDGRVLAEAFGLRSDALARVEHADRGDQEAGRAMSVAVWPAVGGYFLEQLLDEAVPAAARDQIRTHVIERVRGRGPLPAFRVGTTPYGVLPTTAASRLTTKVLGGPLGELRNLVQRAWPIWLESSARAPHVGRGGDPDEQLVSVLGMDASAREYRVRRVLGERFVRFAGTWLDVLARGDLLAFDPARAALTRLGHPQLQARLARLNFTRLGRRLRLTLVDDAPVSEERGLPAVALPRGGTGNYISWLRNAPLQSIQADATAFPGGQRPTALLYRVLRHALLTEYARSAVGVLVEKGLADPKGLREQELVGFEAFERAHAEAVAPAVPRTERTLPVPTAWDAIDHPMPGFTERTIGEHLRDLALRGLPGSGRVQELLAALDVLAELPTAELERLLTETLDVMSHRLDAWVTSLAVEVDHGRRGDGERGFHLGAYGWVEDLRAKPLRSPVTGDLGRKVEAADERLRKRAPGAPKPPPVQMPGEDEAGFVHAPSLAQAAAGAVLRSGHLSHRDTAGGRSLSIDLSSQRVRNALWILDGIREGQSLGALLGYRFERGLAAARLQVLRQPFRDRFPIDVRIVETGGPSESLPAQNVVDGRALHAAWRAGTLWSGRPTASPPQRAAVERLLRDLDDVIDAIGDVSIAESVFQIMRGNPVRAGGLIDAISRGERPPAPEFVRTPRSGIDVTHRLALLMSPPPARAPGWAAGTPRALAEPALDAWVSTLLPPPGRVRCSVAYRRGAETGAVVVTLAELGVGPLDALELSLAADVAQESELEQRILHRARQEAPADADDLRISFAREDGWGPAARSFPEFLTAAQAIHDLIGSSRALVPQDLIEPEQRAAEGGAAIDTAELAARADGTLTRLGALVGELETATAAGPLRRAIVAAGLYGMPSPVPLAATGTDPASAAILRDQARRMGAELRRRLAAARGEDAAFDRTAATPEKLTEHLGRLVRAVFGERFPLLPRFSPPAASRLGAAFSARDALLAGDRDAVERWLAQAGRVRQRVRRLALVREAAALAAGRLPTPLALAQLPQRTPDRWLGLPFALREPPPMSGRVSIVAEAPAGYSDSQPHCGLLLDEWTERIPLREQSSGLAFHYDQPTARAPQALLLAVCPDDRASWDDDTLGAVVGDTLDLAKVRCVDLESLTALGQLIPALYLPFNPGGRTLSVELEDARHLVDRAAGRE